MSIYVLTFCIILYVKYTCIYIVCLFCINSSDHSTTINLCFDPQGRMIFLFLGQKCVPIIRIEKPIKSHEIIASSCHLYKYWNFLTPDLHNWQTVVVNERLQKIMDMLLVMCRFRTVEQRQCIAYIRYAVPSRHNTTLPCW